MTPHATVHAIKSSQTVKDFHPSSLYDLYESWLRVYRIRGKEPTDEMKSAVRGFIEILVALDAASPVDNWFHIAREAIAALDGDSVAARQMKLVEGFWRFACLNLGIPFVTVERRPASSHYTTGGSVETTPNTHAETSSLSSMPASFKVRERLLKIVDGLKRYAEKWGGSIDPQELATWHDCIAYISDLHHPDESAIDSFIRFQSRTTGVPTEEVRTRLAAFMDRVLAEGILPPAPGESRRGQMLLRQAIEKYAKEKANNKAIRDKTRKLNALLHWCDQHACPWVNVDPQVIAGYFQYLANEHVVTSGPNKGRVGLEPQTLENHRVVYHAFFQWCIEKGWITVNPVPKQKFLDVKRSVPPKKPFSEQDLLRLYASFDDSLEGWRNKTLACFFYDMGRVSEVMKAKIRDLDLERRELIVYTKWNKRREVFLSNFTVTALREYLRRRHEYLSKLREECLRQGDKVNARRIAQQIDDGYIFISTRGGTLLTENGARRAIQKVAERAGLDPRLFNPQNIRRTAAVHIQKYKDNPREIQRLMGHEDLSTTERYTGPCLVGKRPNDYLDTTN